MPGRWAVSPDSLQHQRLRARRSGRDCALHRPDAGIETRQGIISGLGQLERPCLRSGDCQAWVATHVVTFLPNHPVALSNHHICHLLFRGHDSLSEKLEFVLSVRGEGIQEPDRRFRDAESLQHLPDEDVQASQGFKYTRPLRTILDLIEADTVERFFCPTGAGTGTPSWADHPAGDQDRQAEWLNPKSI